MPPRSGSLVDHRMAATTDLLLGFASNRTVMCEDRDYLSKRANPTQDPFTLSPSSAYFSPSLCSSSASSLLHRCISSQLHTFPASSKSQCHRCQTRSQTETAAQAHDDISDQLWTPRGRLGPFRAAGWLGWMSWPIGGERYGVANNKL